MILTRCDLGGDAEEVTADLSVSAMTGDGIGELKRELVARLSRDDHGGPGIVGSTAARTAEALWKT